MKKSILALLLIAVLTFGLAACSNDGSENTTNDATTSEPTTSEQTSTESITETEKINVNIATLKGPTGMGMVEIMEKSAIGNTANNYSFELTSSPDDLIGKVINGELDIIAVPTNLAAVLYNRTEGAVQLAAVNTLGVLYVLEDGDSIQTLSDLKGKTLNTSGKGASPDFVIQYLLKENGLTPDVDVMLDYKLEHADLATALVAGDVSIALLPQPHVTTALIRNPDLRVALDITAEWNNATEGQAELAMGVIIVQKAFAEAHPDALNAFLDEYKSSVDFVNTNSKEAAELIAKYEILPNAAVAEKAIPLSNIVYIDAKDAKVSLDAFYKVLFDFEPKSIGGKLVDEGFYYNR
jgi:NitT/TauT family transport system substrate-binding protein